MFNKVLIKSGSINSVAQLNLKNLVDMMLYYKEVHVIVSHIELEQLLEAFSEDVLLEFVRTKRLILHPCDQHVGAGFYGDNIYSIGLFSQNIQDTEKLLYVFHQKIKDDKDASHTFAKSFAEYLEIYQYPSPINKSLYHEVENSEFFLNATKAYLRQYFPSYRQKDDIQIECHPDTNNGFYRIESNLDVELLDKMLNEQGYKHKFGYSGLFLAIGETALDCCTASNLGSELISNPRYAEMYKLRISEYLDNAAISIENIDRFQKDVASKFLTIGESFLEKRITPRELLDWLNKNETLEFRNWVQSLPDDQKLTSELFEEAKCRLGDNWIVKIGRILFTAIGGGLLGADGGLIGGIVGGIVASGIDMFVVDKMINGKNPIIFVEEVLKNPKFLANE